MIGKIFAFITGFFLGTLFGWKVLEIGIKFLLERIAG
jgi:hypothetical protein